MSEEVKALLMGKFPPLKGASKKDLKEEVEMWRNIWGWVPSAVKYYVARTGTQVGVQMRGQKRYVGVLLDTKWNLTHIEVGAYDKIYDQTTGEYFFERKIVMVPIGQIGAFSWIAERVSESEMTAKLEEAKEEALVP